MNSSTLSVGTFLVLNSKRQRAHEKLDYNLKRLLDHIPKELKDLSV